MLVKKLPWYLMRCQIAEMFRRRREAQVNELAREATLLSGGDPTTWNQSMSSHGGNGDHDLERGLGESELEDRADNSERPSKSGKGWSPGLESIDEEAGDNEEGNERWR
ncbi:hypothetical protein TWF696_000944 [Orbilia brochopaga]|uniref:Uncharacterized protein n=1 Tax=Orbilia brochopaga TaxID=3140254 RepID=A0AAV9VEF2_9PEZI